MEFNERKEINAMISAEGETVRFSKKVVPAHARGLVEKWLLQVWNLLSTYDCVNILSSNVTYPIRYTYEKLNKETNLRMLGW